MVNHSSALTSPSPIRWALIALPVLALSTLLAACGGSSKTTTASPTTTAPSGSVAASLAKYTSCLESNGVPASEAGSLFGRRGRSGTGSSTTTPGGSATTTPSGSVPAGGFTRPTIPAQYQAAFTACASDRPTFGGAGFGRGGGINSTAFTAYRNCLEIHGVTLPTTPTTTPGAAPPTGGFGGGFGSVLNTTAGKAAATACANLRPAATGSTTTTTVAG
jgi:hypothetical protein